MPHEKVNRQLCKNVANELNVPETEVSRAVASFFDVIIKEADRLPFDTPTRIYNHDAFSVLSTVRNIPFIGRIGPVYSRYLQWRKNEAGGLSMVSRRRCKPKVDSVEIEALAKDILAGKPVQTVKRKRVLEQYRRVWVVSRAGKRLAWQVIPKDELKQN